MEKNRGVTAAPGADNQRGTFGTRRWRTVDRAAQRDERDKVVRRLSAEGLSRSAIARALGINMAAVTCAQRGGTS